MNEPITERATELEYLRWFHNNADFGPADGEVKDIMRQEFEESTGKAVPEGYAPNRED